MYSFCKFKLELKCHNQAIATQVAEFILHHPNKKNLGLTYLPTDGFYVLGISTPDDPVENHVLLEIEEMIDEMYYAIGADVYNRIIWGGEMYVDDVRMSPCPNPFTRKFSFPYIKEST